MKLLNNNELSIIHGGVNCSTMDGFGAGAILVGTIIGAGMGGPLGGFFGFGIGTIVAGAAQVISNCHNSSTNTLGDYLP